MGSLGVKIKVILPKEVFNSEKVRQAIEHKMIRKTAPDLRTEFEKTVRTWKDQPTWKTETEFGVQILAVRVLTYSTTYRLVNAGARPHIIRPRHKKVLRFQTQFRAKSRPRVVGSFAGGKSGPYVSSLGVHHPGHEAREFDKEIAEQYQETFQKDVQEAISEGTVHR